MILFSLHKYGYVGGGSENGTTVITENIDCCYVWLNSLVQNQIW